MMRYGTVLQVYLCDDNVAIQHKYKELVQDIATRNKVDVKISTFSSGEQLVFHLSEAPNDADIIFLDVMMGKLNGIDAAKELRNYTCHAEIIFLTASHEHVFDAFDASPTHYLLKDTVTESKFENVFMKAVRSCERKSKEYFICENNSVTKQIPISCISYFEIKNRIVTVHYRSETFDFYLSMEKLEQELARKEFARVHRSFLVHLKYIDRIEKDFIVLTTGASIPLGSTYAKNIKLAFSKYLTASF